MSSFPLTPQRHHSPAPEPAEPPQYLRFRLAGERYAVDITHIKEIIEYTSVTPVPLMPPFLRGVINLRGSVVPVIDLAVRFGQPPTEPGRRACIVIAEIPHGEDWQDLGVIVDAVDEVIELPTTDIEAPPAFGTGLRSDFIRGMGRLQGQFLIVLAIERVLSLDELASLAARPLAMPEAG
jgi:purine-binding chemotaxis protein CheW